MALVPEQLKRIADQIHEGGTPEPVTVRSLLSWFNCERRGRFVVEFIRSGLADAGLVTKPDFDSVWLDALIRFQASEPQVSTSLGSDQQPETAPDTAGETAQAPFIGGAVPDPTYKVGKLEAANKGVVSVTPDQINRAVTLMMSRGYSQLPIMVGEREVKGMISWESLARQIALAGTCVTVMDCAEQHREIAADASLFNDVMHFDPDPMGNEELLALRRFAVFVTELSKFLVRPAAAAAA